MFGWHRDNRLWISTSRRSASTATRLRRGGAGGRGKEGKWEGGIVTDERRWEPSQGKVERGCRER